MKNSTRKFSTINKRETYDKHPHQKAVFVCVIRGGTTQLSNINGFLEACVDILIMQLEIEEQRFKNTDISHSTYRHTHSRFNHSPTRPTAMKCGFLGSLDFRKVSILVRLSGEGQVFGGRMEIKQRRMLIERLCRSEIRRLLNNISKC